MTPRDVGRRGGGGQGLSGAPLGRSIVSGFAAGALAAILASVTSLALRSPDPALINSASVTVVLLLAGIAAGAGWRMAGVSSRPLWRFGAWMAITFCVIVLIAALIEAAPGHPLPRMLSYCAPLAAIALGLLAILTPLFAARGRFRLWLTPLAVIAALALGFALAPRAQTQTGRLALPISPPAAPTEVTATAGGPIDAHDVAGTTFVIDPNQSKATYSVHEQLVGRPLPSDAVGTTAQVSGTVFLDGRPSTVSVDMKGFKSDDPARDRHLLFDPGLANWAPARFTVAKLDLPSSYRPGDTLTRQVEGTMMINGVERPMVFSVEARLQDGILSVHGQSDFTWKDFNIRPPSFSGVLQIGDTIHSEVLLVARAQP